MGDQSGSVLGPLMSELENGNNGNGNGSDEAKFQTQVLLALSKQEQQFKGLEQKFDSAVASVRKDVETANEKNKALVDSTINLITSKLDYYEGRLKTLETFQADTQKAQSKGLQTYGTMAIALLSLGVAAFTGVMTLILR